MIDEKSLPKTEGSVYFLLAGALEMSGKTDAALTAARKAAELEPDAPLYASRAGWVLYHAKRYEEADRAYREILATYDKEHSLPPLREMLRDVRMALSAIALGRDDFAAAVEWAEQTLDEFPDDAGALNDLGYIWAERGLHKERALAMTQKAVAAEPDNGSYRDSLGWALFQLGRYEEAVTELTQAVESLGDEPHGVVLDHLGDALQKAGKPTEAQAAWNRAITAFQKDGETEKLNQTREKLASPDNR
jgi:tetratricopeptide (TPR) repeat protein